MGTGDFLHLGPVDDASVGYVVANDADPVWDVHAPGLLLIHADACDLID